ncbi:MAG TPA: hypothetical protein VE622_02815 [Nitrososphaeraceae archaeon]|nr:hypothetical protein [Nitrososphaeraceae archaeon]
MNTSPPPIDAAEFNAHKDMSTIIVKFLCKNKDKAFSAYEIAEAVGIKEEDVNHAMVKLGLSDLVNSITGGVISRKPDASHRTKPSKIDDVTVNGVTYYRCVQLG